MLWFYTMSTFLLSTVNFNLPFTDHLHIQPKHLNSLEETKTAAPRCTCLLQKKEKKMEGIKSEHKDSYIWSTPFYVVFNLFLTCVLQNPDKTNIYMEKCFDKLFCDGFSPGSPTNVDVYLLFRHPTNQSVHFFQFIDTCAMQLADCPSHFFNT